MNRLLFILLLVLSVSFSCKKDERTNEEIPDWLKTKIEEATAESSIDPCVLCDVTVTEYDGKKYYDFYCGLWSCLHCYFFDENGNEPQWETAEWQSYDVGKKEIAVLPICK